jgi:LuxR family maltose regulon positive regulatory protein
LALEHLLRTTEQERTVQLLAQIALEMFQKGQLSTLLRWHSALGDETIKSFPPLAIQACWGAVCAGDTKAAERWAAFVDASSFDGPALVFTASFGSARARLRAAMCAGGPEAMLADATFAASQEQPGSVARTGALEVLGAAHLVAGNLLDARAVFTEVWGLSSADALVVAGAELALLAMDEGGWDEAAARLGRVLATIDERGMQDYVLSALAHVGAARLSLHHGDLQQTRHWLALAMRGRGVATYVIPWIAVPLRLQLAKIYLTLADTTAPRHLLREVDDILAHRPRLGAIADQVQELRRALAACPDKGTGAPPLTKAELRLLPYLQTHLTLGAIAERLFVSRSTVNSEVVSIYRKLGVSSRADAVDRAMAVGMLGG